MTIKVKLLPTRADVRRVGLVSRLTYLIQAREEAVRAEARLNAYLKEYPKLKVVYDDFMRAGGGTIEELDRLLENNARARPMRTIAQKKHMRLVASNDLTL